MPCLGTSGVAAIASDLDYVLVSRVPAVVAAIFHIALGGAIAYFVCAFSFVCHDNPPLYLNYGSRSTAAFPVSI